MKDRLIIDKALIPYTFNILLADNWYQLEVKYNSYADFFTIGLYKDDVCICEGEPLIYGRPLFADFHNIDFPALTIIPVDEAGNNNSVTWDNFGNTVFLAIYNDNDDTINFSTGATNNTLIIEQKEPLFKYVTNDELMAMETLIVSKGGTINKKSDIPTFNELLKGIESISKATSQTVDIGYKKLLVCEAITGEYEVSVNG